MKYTTKELLDMDEKDIVKICHCRCETSKCLFKPTLRELREDGFCINTTYRCLERWINEDLGKIEMMEDEIETLKEEINQYKRWKKILDKELEE